MGILDDPRYGSPMTTFRPQAFSQQTASPMANAAASPPANGQENPGDEQRKKIIQQSVPGKHTPYEETMRGAAKEFDIPYERLFGILNQESSFNPNAVNREIDPVTGRPSSAGGMGQFNDATAKRVGLADRFNAIDSIYATAKNYRYHLDKFEGDHSKATQAHFTGAGGVGSPKGMRYEEMVKGKFPGGTAGPHMETPGMAMPGSSIGGSQPSLAGMDKDQMIAFNETMPASTRSIHAIRGSGPGSESWFNPQQSREFATIGESLRGQPGEATYDSTQKERMGTDRNTALIEATRVENTLKNQGAMDQLNRADELTKQEKPKSAAEVLAETEGRNKSSEAASVNANAGLPTSPEKYKTPGEQEAWDEILAQMEMKKKEEEKHRQQLLGGVQRFGLEDY